jgi:uncharacterized protein YcfL
MREIVFVNLLVFVVASCGSQQKDLLCKQWKAVSINNPNLTAAITQDRYAIDTFGQSEPDLAQVINLDSFKNMRRVLLENDIAEQKKAIEQLAYTFRKDGIALLTTPEGTDSFGWKLNGNQLLMDESALTGIGNEFYFTINAITPELLKLASVIDGDSVEMTFKAMD